MTADLPLGARVLFTRTLHRQHRDPEKGKGNRRVTWEPTALLPYDLARHPDKRLEGIVMGRRTLANGFVWWGSYDEPTTFHRQESVDAYLVAWDLRRKPVLVAPGDLVPLAVQDAVNATLARPEVQDALLEVRCLCCRGRCTCGGQRVGPVAP